MNENYETPVIHCLVCEEVHSLHERDGTLRSPNCHGPQTRCIDCGGVQIRVRGGLTCTSGHGGAPYMTEEKREEFEAKWGLKAEMIYANNEADSISAESTIGIGLPYKLDGEMLGKVVPITIPGLGKTTGKITRIEYSAELKGANGGQADNRSFVTFQIESPWVPIDEGAGPRSRAAFKIGPASKTGE